MSEIKTALIDSVHNTPRTRNQINQKVLEIVQERESVKRVKWDMDMNSQVYKEDKIRLGLDKIKYLTYQEIATALTNIGDVTVTRYALNRLYSNTMHINARNFNARIRQEIESMKNEEA